MKTLLIITTLLCFHSLYAFEETSELPATFTIKTESSDSSHQCKKSEVKNVYLCFSPKENFIFFNEGQYKVIDITNPKEIRYARLQKIEANKKTIFQDTIPEEIVSLLDAATKISNKGNKDTIKDNFFKTRDIKEDFKKIQNLSDPKIKIAARELETQFRNAEKKFEEAVNSDKINLSMKDKTEQTCSRLPPSNASGTCSVFECHNPHDKTEKNLIIYDPEFFPSVMPILQTMKNGQLVPSKDVAKISHAKTKSLLADVAAITDNPQDVSNYRIRDAQKILKTSMPQMAKNYAYLKDYFVIEYRKTQMLSCKEVPLLKQFDKAVDQLFNRVANIPLEVLVNLVDDKLLVANYIDKSLAQENSCKVNGVYVAKDSLEAINYLDSSLSKIENAPHDFVDLETAYRLFEEAKGMSEIAWNYKADGCYARAHLMAREFEKQGIHVDKAWLKGDLGIPEENIQWNYHVAPLIYVKDENNKITPMIIDPSVFPTPVPLDTWVKKISPDSFPKVEKMNFPFPFNVELAHRTVLAISSSEPYSPMESISNTEEKKMELARTTMQEYKELSDNPMDNY